MGIRDDGPYGWSDAALAVTVARRLHNHVGWPRWQVHVERGRLLLCDDFDDPVQQHLAALIAREVPGVVSVDTALRHTCPYHRAGAAVRTIGGVRRPVQA